MSILRSPVFSSMSHVGRLCGVRTDNRFCMPLPADSRLSGDLARCVRRAEGGGENRGGSDTH